MMGKAVEVALAEIAVADLQTRHREASLLCFCNLWLLREAGEETEAAIRRKVGAVPMMKLWERK
jgi:hypothetical protein